MLQKCQKMLFVTKGAQKLLKKTKTFCYLLLLFDLKQKYAKCKTLISTEAFLFKSYRRADNESSADKFGEEIRLNTEFVIYSSRLSAQLIQQNLWLPIILKWETLDFLESLKISKCSHQLLCVSFFLAHGFCFGNTR